MDNFPPDCNRASCSKIIQLKQTELIREVRKNFYDTIMKAINELKKEIKLDFPEELWDKYKFEITCELLDRFGELNTVTTDGKIGVVKLISEKDDIAKKRLKGLIITIDKQ